MSFLSRFAWRAWKPQFIPMLGAMRFHWNRNLPMNHVHMLSSSPFASLNSRLPLIPSQGFKTKASVKKRCSSCYLVRRKGRLYILCKKHPRHKTRQG
ncbi:ribosomal protein subunit L36 [Schizosaccharomyces cryophilus OY26]|uniref:Ribosomal protein n=1 Tax=Schizosaccharomyces cryophilus (strain OY26 / ATCC MYA-4695 / CBS 11777 / NBRC 106824 / NRRL Y48691) TaxID=653667 RepID=S9WWT3_SCHCR|nr:ribosomal protein subunit L36 [Schizosaccharomyces cryophilus OY26]EPY49202.1 ribosomal protein subunit L36 [Schizosaccharomyces cryophilus OY26]